MDCKARGKSEEAQEDSGCSQTREHREEGKLPALSGTQLLGEQSQRTRQAQCQDVRWRDLQRSKLILKWVGTVSFLNCLLADKGSGVQ